jgi:hypothetical protein
VAATAEERLNISAQPAHVVCGTERLPNNSLLLAGPVHTPTPGRGGAWQMGSPAETFFGQRELNFSAGRRIGGRLSEIFPQIPPKPSRSPAAQKKKNPSHQAAGGHPRARVVYESG